MFEGSNRVRRARRPMLETLEDRAVPAVAITYNVTQDWGSGFQGQIRIVNPDSAPLTNWSLDFDFGAAIGSAWDGTLVSHVNTHYVVANAGWNSTIAANGGAVSFGFVASGSSTPPTGYRINGQAIGGPALPTISVGDVRVGEAAGAAVFTVSLSQAATETVSVQYATAAGTATAGSDFTATSGTLTFMAGQKQKTVAVPIVNDAVHESDETFQLLLSSPTKATLANAAATATILDDDAAPPTTGDFQYRVTSDWTSGFSVEVTARNGTGAALSNWSLEFDFAGTIGSIWNASIKSHIGSHYVIQGAAWNASVAAGASVSFGFNSSPSAAPSNFKWSGTTPTDPGQNPPPVVVNTAVWPAHYYAPYVDATLWPTEDFLADAKTSGVRYFTLGFIVADPAGKPAWGGYSDYAVGAGSAFETGLKTQIAGVRALGGDVMVSFGGAANQEFAQVITDVTALKNAYKTVVDAYQLNHLDFDIEGAAAADKASIDRRSQALASLQADFRAAGRELSISLTLPVLPTGLTADGLYLVQSAKKFGLDLAGVNVMTMDYGDSAAPNPNGKMGDYAIQAAQSLKSQLASVYGTTKTDSQLWGMIGLTPMIGMNDVTTEIFDQQEAREVVAFAQQVGLGRISIWSLNRDRQSPSGKLNYVDIQSSSLLQTPLEFSSIFQPFTK